MIKTKTLLLLCVFAIAATAAPLYTIQITSAGENAQVIVPAVQVGNTPDEYAANAFQDNETLYFWEEQQGVLLPGDIALHTSGLGAHDYLSNGFTALPGATPLNSYYAYWDPRAGSISGTITFDSSVQLVAVIVNSDTLDATDAFFIHPNGVAPGDFNARGFERAPDRNNSSVSGNTFSFSLNASTPGDQFRFITTTPVQGGEVPEPSTYALVGSALAGLAFLKRRK